MYGILNKIKRLQSLLLVWINRRGAYIMLNIKRTTVIFSSVLLLSACGMATEEGAPTDLEEEWPQYIQEGADSLESYASDTQIDLEMALGPGLMTDEDETSVEAQIIGDLEQGYVDQDGYELYFDGNDVYQMEGNTWVHYPDEGPIEYNSWYPNVVDSLVEVESFIQGTHNEESLALTYEGNDVEVWDAFEEEFALAIDGISQENIQMSLDATLDDESYYLEDFRLDIFGEEVEGEVEVSSISILVDVEYTEHDAVDLTEIEEEISKEVQN